jgi:glucokinase
MRNNSENFVLGIDLGGTKILSAVISPEGKMLSRDHSITPAAQGRESVVRSIIDSANRSLDQAGIDAAGLRAIGVGAPGLSNQETGVLFTSPNLPGWKDVPLRNIIEDELGKKTFLINDGNAAAVGELQFGAGRGYHTFIYITVSTGIGGGIIIDRKVYSGATGVAGEVGHMAIDENGPRCNCGSQGCWETLASGTALAREARKSIREGSVTAIPKYSGDDEENVTAQAVHQAAQRGDSLAKELITRTGYYLGVGLANLINIFNPQLILIGGGLSNIGDMLLEPAFETAGKRAFPQAVETVKFLRAELGRNSGVIGVAAYAYEQIKDTGA